MMNKHQRLFLGSILFVSLLIILETRSQVLAKQNSSISALFVFGDSTVDPGNNNYITTVFRSNFPPYGRELPNHIPTGRFTDGRLVTDYIASYLGIKELVPPYLDPTLGIKELMTGVSFASAGSGLDPLTLQISSVIPISEQLEYFREYKRKLEAKLGKEKSLNIIKKAGYIISAGTNDIVISYFVTRIRQHEYTVASYQNFLLQQLQQLVKGLENEGARIIGVAGLPPIGCLPGVITLNSHDSFHESGRGCIESYSAVAKEYNILLQKQLLAMQSNGSTIVYVDIYTPLINSIQDNSYALVILCRFRCGEQRVLWAWYN